MPNGNRPPRRVLEELYKNKHKTLKEIGEIYGVSRQRVHQWIDTYGITRIHTQYEKRLLDNPKVSNKELRDLILKGYKISGIAVRIGLGPNGVKSLIQHYGLDSLYEQTQKLVEEANFDINMIPSREVIEELYNQDISIRKILKRLGCSQEVFYKWLAYYGFELRTTHHQATHHRPIIYQPKEWVDQFKKDYKSMTTTKLRQKYNCCQTTLYNWVRKYNIPKKCPNMGRVKAD